MAKRRANALYGLNINRDSICLAQYLPQDASVANVSIQPIEESGTDFWAGAAAAFKDLTRVWKPAGENVVASLPGEYAVIREFLLDTDEPDAAEALEWEFSQQIIGSRDEYVFDFEKLAKPGAENTSRYLVAGYRKDSVDKLARLLKSGKLNPVVMDLDVFALVNVFAANYADALSTPAVLVLADDEKSKCVLTVDGGFVDLEVRPHQTAGQNVKAYGSLVADAVGALRSCNPAVFSNDGPRVFFTGSLFAEPEFAQQAPAIVPNSEILYPFRTVKCGASMQEEELRKFAPHLSVAVGLALRGGDEP